MFQRLNASCTVSQCFVTVVQNPVVCHCVLRALLTRLLFFVFVILYTILEICTLQKLVTSDCRSQFCYIIRRNLYFVTCFRISYVVFYYLALVYCVIFFRIVRCWEPTRSPRPHGAAAPSGSEPPRCRDVTITLRHITLGRTPLDE